MMRGDKGRGQGRGGVKNDKEEAKLSIQSLGSGLPDYEDPGFGMHVVILY